MEVQKLLHMKGGIGQDSYANNSNIHKYAATQVKPVLEETIKEVYLGLKPKCFMMADMGCSSGSNALLVVSEAINVIDGVCQSLHQPAPEFGVFLNDLSGNDFNTLFNFLPDFYKWVEQEKGSSFGPCYVSGTSRSFYGRVFPNDFLHFVYSSAALMWLSKVPEGLVSEQGVGLNKGNIWVAKTSPPGVHKAYSTQFKKDFTMFLSSRAKEVVPGGSMVLTFPGSEDSANPKSSTEFLSSAFHDMVLEGMIEEEKLDKFNMPFYFASGKEVRESVEAQGSFTLTKLEIFTVDWSAHTTQDPDSQANYFAGFIRATCGPMFANAFGEETTNGFLSKLKMKIHQHIEDGLPVEPINFLLISMTKKLEY